MTAQMDPPESEVKAASQRIDVLDVLRGIALLGMFIVHFTDQTTSSTVAGQTWHGFVDLFFEDRFWGIFAILFGVGFAVQMRRAEAAGARFVPRYLRRVAALFCFGLVAEIGFGYHVLVEYAIWSLPLIFVRKWSNRSLVVLLIVCAMSLTIFNTARIAYFLATIGEVQLQARMQAQAAANTAFADANERDRHADDYRTVVRARLRRMPWFYTRPFMFLPVNDFVLFLIGMLGLRLGVFEQPRDHRRLIMILMAFGILSWAAVEWVFPADPLLTSGPLLWRSVVYHLAGGAGLIRDMWLSFTYIVVVLLLVAHKPVWLRRLAPFGWTGRMALTNYMLQVMSLDLIFSNYALGLSIAPWVAPLAALALFAVEAIFSRFWLTRCRYGPLEWLWRSITYWQRQPLARAA